MVQALFGYVGVLLFQACMRKWTFRAVLGATVVLEVAAGAVDLVIVMRWNVTYLHIPDHVMYMLGYNVVFQVRRLRLCWPHAPSGSAQPSSVSHRRPAAPPPPCP